MAHFKVTQPVTQPLTSLSPLPVTKTPDQKSLEKTQHLAPSTQSPKMQAQRSFQEETEQDVIQVITLAKKAPHKLRSVVDQLLQDGPPPTPKKGLTKQVSFFIPHQDSMDDLGGHLRSDSFDNTDDTEPQHSLSRVGSKGQSFKKQSSLHSLRSGGLDRQKSVEALLMYEPIVFKDKLAEWSEYGGTEVNVLEHFANMGMKNCGTAKNELIRKIFLGKELGDKFIQSQNDNHRNCQEKANFYTSTGIQTIRLQGTHVDIMQGHGTAPLKSIIQQSTSPMLHIIDLAGDKSLYGHVYILEQFEEDDTQDLVLGQLHQAFQERFNMTDWNNSKKGGQKEDLLKHIDNVQTMIETHDTEKRNQMYFDLYLIEDEHLDGIKDKDGGDINLQITFSSIPYDPLKAMERLDEIQQESESIMSKDSDEQIEVEPIKSSPMTDVNSPEDGTEPESSPDPSQKTQISGS